MPVEKLDPVTLKKSAIPPPSWLAPPVRRKVNLSVRQIMVALIYFAIASTLGRFVFDTDSALPRVGLGLWVGLGLCYVGLKLAFRLRDLAFGGWIIFIIGFIVMVASTTGAVAIVSIPILIGVIIYLHILYRRNQQNGLLWVLAVASKRQIPLAPGVEAYSRQTRGIYQERCHVLAALLEHGQPLSDAISWVARVVPWDAPLLIELGEKTGRLAAGLREAAEARTRHDQVLRNFLGRIGYLTAVVTVGQGIVGFTAYFIVPRFAAIFKDFGVDLPVATTWLMDGTYYFSSYAPWFGLAQLAFLIYLAVVLGGAGLQALPIVGRLFRMRHKSLILKALALVVEANQPLDQAFEVMVRRYPSKRIRRKLKVAQDLVRSGASWAAALDGVGLISLRDVAVLEAAGRAGNLAWALRTLAESGERRSAYRLQLGSHLVFLAALVLLGALVLFIAIALFNPLVHLIERLV